jgi:hypothetical protein
VTRTPKRPWTRLLAAVEFGNAEEGEVAATPTDLRLRGAFADIRDLPVLDQVELIRSVLRQRKLDLRFETMNTTAWVLRSLATAAGFLALLFVGLVVIDGDAGRLLPTAGGMAIAAGAFEMRARGYQRRSAHTLKFEALALARPPAALRPPTTTDEPSPSLRGESDDAK